MSRPSSLKRAAALALVFGVVLLAAGCGRRGPLEPPEAAATPVPTPSPTAGGDPSVQIGHPKAKPIVPPKTPFLLDPIL
ncbi:MAG: hypothetical protein E7774_11745 [Bradyrhizobium sp.]|nr:MAG: hypothetical protein E7774_11745 [Bradyrhizobium sp.]